MRFFNTLATLGLAGIAASAPSKIVSRQAQGAQNVVYWGQNGGGTIENNDLSAYCNSTAGIDIIVLAFLYQFGENGNIPGGNIGQSCYISSSSGEGQNCDSLTSAIKTCQSNGVKIILSLGGAVGSYTLTSNDQATEIGNYLWEAYGNSGNTSVQRPFGSNFVNGFDFDIEQNNGVSQYFPAMISALRSNFAKDSANTYYITGAPQCPIPEPNMGVIIQNSQFDYLWVQFYNNNNYTVPCALGINGDAPFNYNNWTSFIADTPSKNAKLFIGVPAAPLGANGAPSGEVYYATPSQLAGIVNEYKSKSDFGGVMLWSAGFSDTNVNSGCNYAQEVHAILETGSPCTNGPVSGNNGGGKSSTSVAPPPSTTTAPSSPPPSSSPASAPTPSSTAAGTVPQWGQCGGEGYTGPTQCVAPYKCVKEGSYWSSCQ